MANSNTPGPSQSLPSQSLEQLYSNKQYGLYIDKMLNSKQNFDPGVYHYNLGTAYLKMGHAAASRYHLEKALNAGAVGPRIYKNLNAAMEQLEVKSIEQSSYFMDNALDHILRFPHELCLTLTLALAILWIALLRSNKIKKKFFLLATALSLCPLLFLWPIQNNYQRAIVLEQAFSYEGPSRSFEASNDLPAGVSVIIKKRNDNWLYIEAPTHFSGWIDRKKLGIL